MDYPNKRIFKVYHKKELKEKEKEEKEIGIAGSHIRRKKLLLKHDKESERTFTSTNPTTTKKLYTKREALWNVTDTVYVRVQEKGEWKLQEKRSDIQSDNIPLPFIKMERKINKSTTTKCRASFVKFQRINKILFIFYRNCIFCLF